MKQTKVKRLNTTETCAKEKKTGMNIPPIFILCHPEYEPIRYQLLLSHLPKRGIPLEKVNWVRGPWGNELTSEEFFRLYDPFNGRFGMDIALSFKSEALLAGELSLVMRLHIAIQECLAMKGQDTFLIFESDVVLREDFLERLQDVLKIAGTGPWDYISLGEGQNTRPPTHAESYFGQTVLCKAPHSFVFRGTDSMLFRRSFLEKLSQTLFPIRECMDWEMNIQMMVHKGLSLWADPPLVEPGSGRWRTATLLPG